MKFTLKNSHGFAIRLALEPEGEVVEIPEGEHVFVELSGSVDPIVEVKINQRSSGLSLSIWPSQGKYAVYDKNQNQLPT